MKSGLFNSRHTALLLLSAVLLAFQIVLFQALATSQWHHFAYLVISVALLGFGAAGTLLSLARGWMLARAHRLLPILACACAVTMAGSLGLIQGLIGGFDSLLIFVNPDEWLRLAASALLLMLPFSCGALAIGIVFTSETARIGSYYCANLFGSGIGCLLGLAGLASCRPSALPPLFGLVALVAALPLLVGQLRSVKVVASLSALLVAICIWHQPELALSQYKDLSRALDLPQAKVIAQQPSTYGQLHVVASPLMRSATGLSLRWRDEPQVSPAIFINGDKLGNLPPAETHNNPLRATTMALPYAIRTADSALVLNASTGQAVALALGNGVDRIVAVEPHDTLIEVLHQLTQEEQGGLFADERVRWESASSRTWLARKTASYDLVLMPDIGSFGGSAGLFALHEQPLLTRQALQQAWQKLTADGILCITSWIDYPVRNPLRLLTTLVELLLEVGADPARQIAAVRSWGTVTFCIKKSALTAQEIAATRTFAERWAFDVTLLPGLDKAQRQSYNRLQDDTLLTLIDATFDDESRHDLYHSYPFRIEPTSDDRPFFSQFLRWSQIDLLLDQYGQHTVPFLELGILLAGLAAVILTLLAILLILLPLIRLKAQAGASFRTCLYFGALGVGYMWTEMALIHRFELYIGQPVYSAALVIAVLLIGSAIGSLVSGHFNSDKPWRFARRVCLLLVLYAIVLGPILQGAIHLTLLSRTLVAITLLTPAAIVMGMPFPLGLRHVNSSCPSATPWAWGINGCLSVAGASVATLIAVEAGYSSLLLLAAAAYLLPTLYRMK